MQILVADDDPICRELLTNFLTQLGYDVAIACDGLEAWELLQRPGAPELVILDWMMPRMDGYEVCRKARQEGQNSDLYILFLTGGRMREDMVKALVAGADDYLIKPFDPMDLKTRLRTAERILSLQSEVAHLQGQLQSLQAAI